MCQQGPVPHLQGVCGRLPSRNGRLGSQASGASVEPSLWTPLMRLNHVTLIVSSFETSKAFYKALGLIQIVDAPPRYARFQLPAGESTLSIEVMDRPPAFPSAQLFLELPSASALDMEVARLKAEGLVFSLEPTDMDYLWREARLVDPDGHDIRLYHAGENRLNPPWKVRP